MAGALVLFDIDGTLLRKAGPQHGEALVTAVRRVTGLQTTMAGIATQGMLDQDILRLMLHGAGASRRLVQQALPAIMREAQDRYARTCPDLRPRVCPGVRALLWRLRRRGVATALVTGNLTQIGWRKMERAGLRHFFRGGAFAESARTRAGLARLAVAQARRVGCVHRGTRISLIGDHPNDVDAARQNGFRAVAVATGHSSEEELKACGAEVVVPDLTALPMGVLL